MIELILVQTSPAGEHFTVFWGDTPHQWPADVFSHRASGLRIASPAALPAYRDGHARLGWSPVRHLQHPPAC